jgi:hypothetical protein
MLGQLTWQHQAYSGLNLTRAESSLLVVSGKLSSFSGNTLKNIIDKGVHDGHALLGDTSIRVDLFEDLVDVGAVSLCAFLGLLATSGSLLGWGLGRLFGGCLNKRKALEISIKRQEKNTRVTDLTLAMVAMLKERVMRWK